jgi:hypothetical protein
MISSSVGDGVDQLVAVLLGLVLHVGRDLLDRVVLAELGLAAPHQGLHLDQVDDAGEVGLGTDRQLERRRSRRGGLDGCLDGEVEVGAERSILLTKQMRGTPYLSA